MVDRTETAPFKELSQLKDFADCIQSYRVAAIGNHSVVLVLDLGAAFGDLFEHHPNAVQDIQRLEARDYQRLLVMFSDKPI